MECSIAGLCRLFLYENIPQLRYHNPSVKFSFEAHQDPDSQLIFTMSKFNLVLIPKNDVH